MKSRLVALTLPVLASLALPAAAQSMLPTYPGYEQAQAMQRETRGGPPFISGAITPAWTDGGKGFDYSFDGKAYHYDVATLHATELPPPADGEARGARGARGGGRGGAASAPAGRGRGAGVIGGGGGVANTGSGRQISTSATSPDQNWQALSRNNNVYLVPADGSAEIQLTSDGNAKDRIVNGVSNIVYGEDLAQGTSIWWAPNSRRVAFYRFDQSKVKDFTVLLDQGSSLYNTPHLDPYPKVGEPGLVADLLVYDLDAKKVSKLDVRDGKPNADETVGFYVYRPGWSPDSSELIFSRMNRKQNTLELCAGDPATGKCRVILHEERLANWVEWQPAFEYMPDHQRFIISSERTDFKHYYLYDLAGKQLATLTRGNYDVASLVKIDEKPAAPGGGQLYYMARDGENYLKLQLHRVNLDGTGDVRLTDPNFLHTVSIAPDGNCFVDVYESHDQPPAARLLDGNGKVLAELTSSDMTRWDELKLKRIERFDFKTYDGTAALQGILHFPSNFDPGRKYPLLLSVYGGPNTSGARETFGPPNPLTEYGFLVAQVDARSLAGRGRRFSDPFYHHLGIIEMDDQAAGVSELAKRPYVNKDRVGVFGTSYGGTSAATLLMRYPDLFRCASSSSPVTDYRNYNCVYAERQ
ncbi:MAG TPA: DPP IV N-terminal domain-containing protein, partial [Phycisphaerae bacterium]|nr:DPP IV N-terminal domain-containing protein [Phycisphaerae bacterium]